MVSTRVLTRSHSEDTRFSSLHHRHTHRQKTHSQQVAVLDKFEEIPKKSNKLEQHRRGDRIRYCHVFKDAKKKFGKPLQESHKIPWPTWESVQDEEKFVQNPNTDDYIAITKEFKVTKLIAGHQKYMWLNQILIDPDEDLVFGDVENKFIALENWHEHKENKFDRQVSKARKRTENRHKKIEEKGLGFGGKMTEKIARSKAASFYAKNNLTIRGNVFKLTHEACPKNIYEMMPRYGYRKSAHVGVRIGQFTINGILSAIGYALTPITFGVSKIISNSIATVVTLTGESITHKIEGAEKRKISVHAGLRGCQLEIPLSIPLVGNILYNGDSMLLGVAATGIVSTTIADAILYKYSDRYATTMNIDDLGNSRCLEELNSRIDYLSKFLLPYGQFLLLKEQDEKKHEELRLILKKRFKTLRMLEKKKIESLNFYRLALAAEKIPQHLIEKISIDVRNALPETRVNTHRIVKRCLAVLIERDGAQQILKRKPLG